MGWFDDTFSYWEEELGAAANWWGDVIGDLVGYDASDWGQNAEFTDTDAAYAYSVALVELVGTEQGWEPDLIDIATTAVGDAYTRYMFSTVEAFYEDLGSYFSAGPPPPWMTPEGWLELGPTFDSAQQTAISTSEGQELGTLGDVVEGTIDATGDDLATGSADIYDQLKPWLIGAGALYGASLLVRIVK